MLTPFQVESLRTYPIDGTGAVTHTIVTPAAGQRWVLFYLVVTAQGATNLQLLSGATALTGTQAIDFTAAGTATHSNGGFPIATGRVAGEALNIASSGAVDVDGWALVGMVQG